ncbi:restriction endonuclease subunit S [Elizabethkingia anophelis]|nr:restriction endonuclease subunit S [Elizabethkingia anophelis]MYZ61335.1 restriction endonuclease subunit S [Elizabethkingia anophelis]
MEFKSIKELCIIEKGSTGISKAIPGNYPLVVTSEERKSHNEFQFDDAAVIIPLVSSTGHGHASLKRIHYQEGKFAVGSILCAIIPKNKNILNAEFLYHFLNLNKDKELVSRMRGMANVTLPIKEIEKIKIPVLSIDEQKQFIEYYTKIENHSTSVSSEITHQLDLIKDLRQAFLREAMQGLLVSNETSDGKTGADLLAEIQAEKAQLIKEKKIKKPKPLAPITQEEIPFEIPENWTWCRLGEIVYTAGRIGWKGLTASEYKKSGPMFISVHSLNYGDYVDYSQVNYISEERYIESPEIMLKNKDILICKDGAGIGKLGIVKNLTEKATINSSLLLIRNNKGVNYKFLYYNLLSPFFQRIVNERIMGATTPHLYQRDIVEFTIPLPPLEIQERTVSKLDELMAFCDQLEEQIKQSQQTNDLLLQQVLREALGEKKEEKGKFTELQLVAEPTEQYIAKQFTTKTCDKNDMAILTGYIIHELNTKDFGRVKLQKMLHLVEYHCQLETNFNYYKKVAGPHAEELKESIEPILQRNRFFDIKKEKLGNKEKVNYTVLAGASQINKFFNSDFKEQKENIDFVLHKFRNKTWEFCEMISTMYAVWNNRLIKQQSITNDDLKKDFLEWDKEKIKFVDQLDYAIEWIKKENMEPKGLGKYIDKPQAK